MTPVNNRAGDYILTLNPDIDRDLARVFEAASASGISLRVLAKKAKVSLSTVWLLKEGRRACRMTTLRKLQKAVRAL
jgi:predicted transcriptional regulator